MTEQLKPCPFCGANVYIEKKMRTCGAYGYYINRRDEYDIHCHNCGCRVRLEGNNTIDRSDEEAKANAIKAWNRRAYNKSN